MPEGNVGVSAVYNAKVIATVAAADANGASAEYYLPRPQNGMVFVLDHTVDESTVLDTLDVYVQARIDPAGANWLDVGRFAQHVGNQGAERRILQLVAGLAVPEFDYATALLA